MCFFSFCRVFGLISLCFSLISENIDGWNYDADAGNCENDDNNVFFDDEDETDEMKNFKFRSGMRKWAVENNIPQVALRSLMSLINTRVGDTTLPRDPRTLLETPKIINIANIGDFGQYWHHGLGTCLRRIFWDIDEPKTISLNINMDGLPIFNSSKLEFWPILFTITEMPHVPAMPIGIFCWIKKCPDLEAYLTPFVDEMKDAMENGVYINSHKITVRLRCFVCDSPARAYVKGTNDENCSNLVIFRINNLILFCRGSQLQQPARLSKMHNNWRVELHL